jgi:hypothetical protein
MSRTYEFEDVRNVLDRINLINSTFKTGFLYLHARGILNFYTEHALPQMLIE